MSNVRDAFSFYRRSLDQARETGARRYQAYALAAIGLWFDNHGDSHQALSHLRESLEVREQQGNRAMIAQGLRDLARVVRRTDAARARDLLTRAEQLYKQMTMLLGRIEVLLERSEIYLEERQFDQAIQDLTTALQLGEQLGAAAFNVRVDALLKLGGAYDAEGQPWRRTGHISTLLLYHSR